LEKRPQEEIGRIGESRVTRQRAKEKVRGFHRVSFGGWTEERAEVPFRSME